jgi:hypothetical protein
MLPVIHMVQATSVLSSPRPLERLKRLRVIFHTLGQETLFEMPAPAEQGLFEEALGVSQCTLCFHVSSYT